MGRKRKSKKEPGHNKHHLLFYRANFAGGHAKLLRAVFVYDIDEEVHRELHKRIEGIPRPSDADLKYVWRLYNEQRAEVDAMGIVEACKWLMLACDDIDWQNAMYEQWRYLEAHTKP